MDDLQTKIDSFPNWHYQFELQGLLTPIHNLNKVNRHIERKRYFFDRLVEHYGGSLKGKRVLDLGCNAGFWSLAAIENECDFILGIDGRQMHVDQANLVFESKKIDPKQYVFVQSDLFDVNLLQYGTFDIVLFLGLLYHINRPIELFEKVSQVNADILVVDTSISPLQGSLIEVRKEDVRDPRNALKDSLIFVPTKKAVADMMENVGYHVGMLEVSFTDYLGADDYRRGLRKAFFGSKQHPLDSSLFLSVND